MLAWCYRQEVSSTKRGARNEGYRLEQFKRADIAKQSLAGITGAMIAKWRDARLKEVSSGTALRDLQLLGHVFTMAMRKWGLALPCNPVEQIQKPAPSKARDRALTDGQRTHLLYECGQCATPWIKPAVMFALETGARRGEILGLKWADVDLERATARVPELTMELHTVADAMYEVALCNDTLH